MEGIVNSRKELPPELKGLREGKQAESLGLYKCEKLLSASPRATRALCRVLKGARGWRRSSSGGAEPQWVSMTQRDRSGERRLLPARDSLKHSLGRVFAEPVL